ncbi:MAG: hypothetical protein DMG05_13165 [Acidobacteria bacterium]|nr:MAG: hypothetical protein DMG05_13165 [Acidobacteriota bacterium]
MNHKDRIRRPKKLVGGFARTFGLQFCYKTLNHVLGTHSALPMPKAVYGRWLKGHLPAHRRSHFG